MRRIAIATVLLLIFLPACFYSPVYVDPPARPGGAAGARPNTGSVCHEAARNHCAAEACGPNSDYVTLRCADGRTVRRCVANLTCSAR